MNALLERNKNASRAADAESLFRVLEATGMERWKAIGVATSACGTSFSLEVWLELLMGTNELPIVFEALNGISGSSPAMADYLLQAWLQSRRIGPGSSLDLRGMKWITALPQGLFVCGWLDVSGCDTLVKLPKGLDVGCSLTLSECQSLRALPGGIRVGGDTTAYACLSLMRIPGDGIFAGHLLLTGCRDLVSLPKNLKVGATLDLCFTSIRHLPKGLRVGGDLDLRQCRDWDGRFPADMVIGGKVVVRSL